MLTSDSLSPVQEQKTILLCSNDVEALELIGQDLIRCEYHVLSSGNGEEAVRQMNDYGLEIDLLLSALDMPGINGLGLAAQVSTKWPDLKVLLMLECRVGTLILNEGWHFLPKPFVTSQLRALILALIMPERVVPKYQRAAYP